MSVEDRLRDGLARNAASLQPGVEAQLDVVLRRGRRDRLRRAAAVLVVVVVPLLTALVAVALGERAAPVAPGPAASAETTPASQALTGTFTTTVPAAAPSAQSRGLTGGWTLRFQGQGNLTVQAPAGYAGVVSGALFTATPGRLRTGLFATDLCSGSGVGVYHWTRSGRTLVLTVVDDACEGRVTVFTSAVWKSVP